MTNIGKTIDLRTDSFVRMFVIRMFVIRLLGIIRESLKVVYIFNCS